ncbi:methylmalonyl-CoA mutase family protein [Terricaulis silvestris]|uniref:Methylmalonyl-CoA mutase small subunit n=1 Tax=Terricaulis silvestris TaxID=2686094 RepID=A0A6I6MVA4_9CAUL|nr:methylmalonyl-CoA mutase family protein [Terricaulis silvestris]QGZ95542.1 Methylmalonyl-CoA mutase small subunit [Terricaulis silvestris]
MSSDKTLQLGEPADEADWRALVEQGLKGAAWSRLVGKTADGIPLEPLYREPNMHTAEDVSGMPGAAPFVRGAGAGAWTIRQAFGHPDPARTNDEILADLQGGVGAIELVIDPHGKKGVAIRDEADFDLVLAGVVLEAAPVSLDAGGQRAAEWLAGKHKGVAAPGTAYNVDPIGTLMRTGEMDRYGLLEAALFAARIRATTPAATAIRVDARQVHEAGGTEAQEIATALSCGVEYLRSMTSEALTVQRLAIEDAGASIAFAMAVGPDVLIEAAKLRALRLCWARVLEASGASPAARAAHIHAFTSRRMMTRYDAWTNILRVSTAAFAAAVGGADDITTYPLTDALGLPTPFSRRVARNTQHVLLEECRLGHVADPAGGSWFVEKLTRDLADNAWAIMQQIEARGGIVAALQAGLPQDMVATARTERQRAIATRRETITGVTDYPLLDAAMPATEPRAFFSAKPTPEPPPDLKFAPLAPIRWAAPFEALRGRAETGSARPAVFFANLATLAEFAPRAQWSRNLLASGGVGSIGPEEAHATMETLIDALRLTKACVAIITGTDARYAEHAENAAQRLKAAGADWVLLAGKPGENEAKWRAAGVDQFVFAGQDAIKELETLHVALRIAL